MCEFCEQDKKGFKGKHIPFDITGNGIGTADQNVKFLHDELQSLYKEFGFSKEKVESKDYIYLKGPGNTLWCQTSSGEYRDLGVTIKYCPFCGRKL